MGNAANIAAHVVISKFCDSLPLYRQAQMFKRQGIALDRSTLSAWVGRACWWLKPIYELVLGTAAELKAHAALMRRFPEMEHADPNQVSVPSGETGELVWKFTRAGKFDFACLQPGHFESGMVGKVAVQ